MKFEWLNESKVIEEGNKIQVFATPNSDFFYSSTAAGDEGITPESLCNAPFYYTEIKGDFVMRAKVSHDFKSVYDSSSIMVYKSNSFLKSAQKADFLVFVIMGFRFAI